MKDSLHASSKQSPQSPMERSKMQRTPQDLQEKLWSEQSNGEGERDHSVDDCLPSRHRPDADKSLPLENGYNDVINDAIRSVTEQSFNSQSTFDAVEHDRDEERGLHQVAACYRRTSSAHPTQNSQRDNASGSRPFPHSASLARSIFPSGDDTTPMNFATSSAVRPSSETTTTPASQNEWELILHQYYLKLETEKQRLLTSSEVDQRYLHSHVHDGLHRQNNKNPPTSLPVPAFQYFEQRLGEEVVRRRLAASSLSSSTSSSLRSNHESPFVTHPPYTDSRISQANNSVPASFTSPFNLAGETVSFARQRIAGRALDEVVGHPHPMSPPSLVSLVLPPSASSVGSRDSLVGDHSLAGSNNRRSVMAARTSSGSRLNGGIQSSYAVPEPPPCLEGPLPPHYERTVLPLGTQDDANWCSDLYRFVRCELVEVFRASGQDVAVRIHNKRILYRQVGIRCRFCAHVPRDDRACRAVAFPSSISRIQHTVGTMVREHFTKCTEAPDSVKTSLATLKERKEAPTNCPGSYWMETASLLGLVDTPAGIMHITDAQQQSASFTQASPGALLIEDEDRDLVQNFSFFLMSQAQRISLSNIDAQRGIPQGISFGFGCRHCCNTNGNAKRRNRFFPPKRRLFQRDVDSFYKHLEECSMCPEDIKVSLSVLKNSAERRQPSQADEAKEKAFFSRIWTRMHGNLPVGVPAECRERSKSKFSDAEE